MRRVILGAIVAASVASAVPAMAAPAAGALTIDTTAATQTATLDRVQWRDNRNWARDHYYRHDRDHDRGYHRGWRRPHSGYYYSGCRFGSWRDRWGRLHCRTGW